MNDPEGRTFLHPRWAPSRESTDFFIDEDRLLVGFFGIVALSVVLLGLLAVGLWRLERSALAPPIFVGIDHGHIFSGRPETLASVRESDFDSQLSDTVEILFGRTEKGLPPAIKDFCAPDVVAAVDRDYQDAAAKYPAGYVQTLALLEAKAMTTRPGYRRMYYRGLLSSRSQSAAQTSPIYLDCTFAISSPTTLNEVGWRLVRMEALSRDSFYAEERDEAARKALSLPPKNLP